MENDNGENPPNNVQPSFSCDQCGKEFPSKAALRGHRISHFRRPRADVAPPPPPPPPRPLEQEEPRQRRVLALHCPGPNPPPPAKGKRGRGPTKPVVSSAEAHAVSDANNLNQIFDMLIQLIMPFVSGGGNDSGDPSSSSKRLRPDYHLAQGLNYDEATDTVSFQRRALLIHQGGDPSNAFVDRGADDNHDNEGGEGKEQGEGERRGGEGEEEEDGGGGGCGVDESGGDDNGGGVRGGSDDDGAGPSGEGSRIKLPDLNDPLPENDD